MADYIEREVLLEAIDKAFDESPIEETTAWMLGRRIVKNFPAADVEEVKHGEWIEQYDETEELPFRRKWFCSVCGEWQTYGVTKRCSECGAKMDGKGVNINETMQ